MMTLSMIRRGAVLAVVLLTGCVAQQVEPSFARLGETIELGLGKVTRIGDEGLMLAFRQVPQDSRCPSNVTCVWTGDATVRLDAKLGNSGWTALDVHTHVPPHDAEYGDYVVELHGLLPWPREGLPTLERDYRVTLRVRRR
jgi:hypothetical protein